MTDAAGAPSSVSSEKTPTAPCSGARGPLATVSGPTLRTPGAPAAPYARALALSLHRLASRPRVSTVGCSLHTQPAGGTSGQVVVPPQAAWEACVGKTWGPSPGRLPQVIAFTSECIVLNVIFLGDGNPWSCVLLFLSPVLLHAVGSAVTAHRRRRCIPLLTLSLLWTAVAFVTTCSPPHTS